MESVCGRRQGRMLISWRNNERSGLKSRAHYAQILRNASHEDHHPPLGADRTVGSFGSVSVGKPACKKTNVFKIQRHLQKEVPTSFGIEFVTVPTECKRVLRFASVTPHSNVRDADLPFRRF